MPRATVTPTTPAACLAPAPAVMRRDLFGGAAALLLLSAAEAGPAKADELDGELIAICAQIAAWDRQIDRLRDDLEEMIPADPRREEIWGRIETMRPDYAAAMLRASRLPARTPEGVRAKARVVTTWLAGVLDGALPAGASPEERLTWSLLDDVTGRA